MGVEFNRLLVAAQRDKKSSSLASLSQYDQRLGRSKTSRPLAQRVALTSKLGQLVHAADLATGPKFNQIATAVITMMMTTKISTLMANLRAVMPGFLSNEEPRRVNRDEQAGLRSGENGLA